MRLKINAVAEKMYHILWRTIQTDAGYPSQCSID